MSHLAIGFIYGMNLEMEFVKTNENGISEKMISRSFLAPLHEVFIIQSSGNHFVVGGNIGYSMNGGPLIIGNSKSQQLAGMLTKLDDTTKRLIWKDEYRMKNHRAFALTNLWINRAVNWLINNPKNTPLIEKMVNTVTIQWISDEEFSIA